jgi:hypothetical protein
VDIALSNQLQGAEANGLANLASGDGFRVDLLGGFRYLYLNERLRIVQTSTLDESGSSEFAGGSFTAHDVMGSFDEFETRNNFYGGQLGAKAEVNRGRFTIAAIAKVALGDTHETVNISGNTTVTSTSSFTPLFGGGTVLAPALIFFPSSWVLSSSRSPPRATVSQRRRVRLGHRFIRSLHSLPATGRRH